MSDLRIRNLSAWIEAMNPTETPWLRAPWAPPPFTYPTLTKRERIEPWATRYEALERTHPDYYSEEDAPDEWYQPTKKLRKLERRLDRLRERGFRQWEEPNPDYDPVRAEEWRASHQPFSRRKVEWGQFHVEPE